MAQGPSLAPLGPEDLVGPLRQFSLVLHWRAAKGLRCPNWACRSMKLLAGWDKGLPRVEATTVTSPRGSPDLINDCLHLGGEGKEIAVLFGTRIPPGRHKPKRDEKCVAGRDGVTIPDGERASITRNPLGPRHIVEWRMVNHHVQVSCGPSDVARTTGVDSSSARCRCLRQVSRDRFRN